MGEGVEGARRGSNLQQAQKAIDKLLAAEAGGPGASGFGHFGAPTFVAHQQFGVRLQLFKPIPNKSAFSVLNDLRLPALIDHNGDAAGCHRFDGRYPEMLGEFRTPVVFAVARGVPENLGAPVELLQAPALDVGNRLRAALLRLEAYVLKVLPEANREIFLEQLETIARACGLAAAEAAERKSPK